jgi:CubicO group peptidase (beta-lactamase class C family)
MLHRLPLHFALLVVVAPIGCVSSATPGKPLPARTSTAEPLRFDDPARVSRIVAAARALEPSLIKTLEKTRAPGAALGLVVDGQLVYFLGVGVREVSADSALRVD